MPSELTGRRRYRKLLEGKTHISGFLNSPLILQVEVSEFVTGREDSPGRWVCRWRDATAEDVNKE
jgi:hypothetical protein